MAAAPCRALALAKVTAKKFNGSYSSVEMDSTDFTPLREVWLWPTSSTKSTRSDISRSVHDLCLNSRVVRAARLRSFSRARKSDRLGKGNELPFAELHRVTKLVVIDRTAKDGRQPFGGAE